MNEIQVFENSKFGSLRTEIDERGNVIFCGYDVAKALGYRRANDAIRHIARVR